MSSTTTPEQGQTLTVTRTLNFPRERVYAAFTSAEKMSQWFGCSATKNVKTDFEPTVGKRFYIHMEMSTDDHGEMETHATGEVLEVNPPERIRFAINFNIPDYSRDTEVEVDFIDRDGATEIRLQHHNLVDMRAKEGWTASLEKLEKCLAG